jgi:hypothetical protein
MKRMGREQFDIRLDERSLVESFPTIKRQWLGRYIGNDLRGERLQENASVGGTVSNQASNETLKSAAHPLGGRVPPPSPQPYIPSLSLIPSNPSALNYNNRNCLLLCPCRKRSGLIQYKGHNPRNKGPYKWVKVMR